MSPSRCCCASRSTAPRSLRRYRDVIEIGAPTRSAAGSSTSPARPRSSSPSTWSGRLLCACCVTYAGTEADAARRWPSRCWRSARGGDRRGDAVRRRAVHARRPARACGTTGRPSTRRGCPTRPWTSSAPGPDACSCRRHSQHILFPQGGAIGARRRDYPCRTGTPRGSRTPSGSGRTPRTTSGAPVGPRRPRRRPAVEHRRGLPQLHRRRGRGPGRGRLRRRELPAAGRGEGRGTTPTTSSASTTTSSRPDHRVRPLLDTP